MHWKGETLKLSGKLIRSQLALVKPFVVGCSLETARKGQDRLGEMMEALHKNEVTTVRVGFEQFDGSMVTPADELVRGVILYLHGGGYTCGDLNYAEGFGTVLAAKCGIKVFCCAYRLAPEYVYPAALDDSLCAYRYLLSQGYRPDEIVLSGESAGGGLVYALCLKLKSLGEPLPAGIIAMSPWSDLTQSGETYDTNRDVDPSMVRERLDFFANCYVHGTTQGIDDGTEDLRLKRDPFVSPLFGDLSSLPPSLIFVGGDEVMLDDSRRLHAALLGAGCRSSLYIAENMWHAYVLYCLKENMGDFDRINSFLSGVLSGQKKLRWMRLDNAAKIFPASRSRNWSNVFRLSATLTEEVDRAVLKSALDVTVRRFPSIAVRVRRGVFWYYLEEIPKAPEIVEEKSYPLSRMPFDDIRKCAFRVIAHENRIAVEVFHALTDGNGGLVFLKTLVAEYLTEKYGIDIPSTDGVLDRLAEPSKEELEDSFQNAGGPVSAGRGEKTAYRIGGTKEQDGFKTATTLILEKQQVVDMAKRYDVTVTTFLTAAVMQAVIDIQREKVPNRRKRKPVKVLIPVNLRKLYNSVTLRNFVFYVTPELDPRLGDYGFEEICAIVHHSMGLEITKKHMSMHIAANVNDEKLTILKIMPLFIKNIALKAVFLAVGEKKSCFSFSNLGVAELPAPMKKYVTRLDFVLDVQQSAPYNVGIITYGEKMNINIIRNIREPVLEYAFFKVLRDLGLSVEAESNQRLTDEGKDRS